MLDLSLDLEGIASWRKKGGYGPELIVNGDGSSAASWTASGGSVGVTGGKLRVTGDGIAYQTITTIIGRTYRVLFDQTPVTAVGQFVVGNFAGDASRYNNNQVNGAGQVGSFTATATTTYVSLYAYGAGLTCDYDNISVRQVL